MYKLNTMLKHQINIIKYMRKMKLDLLNYTQSREIECVYENKTEKKINKWKPCCMQLKQKIHCNYNLI